MSITEYKPGLSIEDLPTELQTQEPLKLASNENPLGPSPLALQAIRDNLDTLNTYPSRQLEWQLRQAIAASISDQLGPEHIVIGSGGIEVLEFVARNHLTRPDAASALPRQSFPFLARYSGRSGNPINFFDLDEEDFSYHPERIAAAITPGTRLVYVCNPNNPTGTYTTATALRHITAVIPDDVLLIHDEAYIDFVDTPDFPDLLPEVLAGKNLFLMRTFAKIYGLAALRLGYGIASPAVIERVAGVKRNFHVNKLALVAGLAALNDAEHRQRTIANNMAGKQWLTDQLTRLGCRVWPSQANFVLFSHQSVPAQTLIDGLMALAIIVRPAFGLDNHIRLSIGMPEQNARLVKSLTAVLQQEIGD
ncbi:MAG: aminotransferase class I/II-fold pyridoxal phosphate-dependent enzyme [Anaerolineaceae bacterium]|nr:aminotransferase class I/II-fold pyridoxal phosphate-dependent enzyme [Anaerolineaceae bacterium]